jgi:hypothetical protein
MLRRRLPGQHVRVLGGHRGGRLQPPVAHQLVAVPEIGHLDVEGHHWPRFPFERLGVEDAVGSQVELPGSVGQAPESRVHPAPLGLVRRAAAL